MIALHTFSGKVIDLHDPDPDDILLEDIVLGLSHACRYAGHMPEFYSVAQHSLLVAQLCPVTVSRTERLAALLHDSAEAYMGDMTRRLKYAEGMETYRRLEKQLQGVIWRKFGVPTPGLMAGMRLKAQDDLAAIFEQWTLVFELPWDAEEAIPRAVASDFVGSQAHMLRWLAPRLPGRWMPMTHLQAREALRQEIQDAITI